MPSEVADTSLSGLLGEVAHRGPRDAAEFLQATSRGWVRNCRSFAPHQSLTKLFRSFGISAMKSALRSSRQRRRIGPGNGI